MKLRYLGFLLLFGAAVYGGYLYLHREKAVAVTVVTVAEGLVESTVANTRAGTVKARNRAKLAPSLGGQIETLNVQEGDQVKQGQILLTLWNDDVKAELELSMKEAEAADALAKQSCLLADYSERESRRLTELRQKKSTSEALYDKALTTALTNRTACEAAKIQAAVSLARVGTVQALLEKTILRAPFSGIVAEVNGEIGEFVTPSPTGVATLPAIDLINLNDLYVTAPIDEIDAARVREGMRVRISLDAFPEKRFAGSVLRIAPYVLELAKQARTVEVECRFNPDDQPENLLAGYSADVEIVLDTKENTLRIPAESLLEGDEVYVVDRAAGRIHRKKVRVGLANWRFVEILAGLAAGDQVVASAARQGLADGVLVQIENTEDASSQ